MEDKFGVPMVYPSGGSLNHWEIPDKGKDERGPFENENRSGAISGTGIFSYPKNGEVRNEVHSVPDVPKDLVNGSHATYRKRGYMLNNNDWKNIEMTGYYKGSHAGGPAKYGGSHIEHVMRGGYNDAEYPCSASNYHMNLYCWDNDKKKSRDEVHVEKDQWHGGSGSPHGYSQNSPKTLDVGAGSPIENRWIGWKTVVYNNDDETVTIEAYIDKSTDGTKPGVFTKVFSFTDSKGKMGKCKGPTSDCVEEDCQLPITYGGPIVNFRWDQLDTLQFKWLSVREIQPPTSHSVDTT
jgi:hypothetical protein